jgi:hypothetical protein
VLSLPLPGPVSLELVAPVEPGPPVLVALVSPVCDSVPGSLVGSVVVVVPDADCEAVPSSSSLSLASPVIPEAEDVGTAPPVELLPPFDSLPAALSVAPPLSPHAASTAARPHTIEFLGIAALSCRPAGQSSPIRATRPT